MAVTDWAHDFDHTDDEYAADPFPIWDRLREECPIAHSDRFGGVWLPTRHEDVSAIAYDTDHFTSRAVVVSNFKPPDFSPRGPVPPISSDPPFHPRARKVLLPPLSPRAVADLEPTTREYCRQLVDALAGREEVDAAVEYAQHIPVRIIARMLGFPESDADTFRDFVHHVIEQADLPVPERAEGMERLFRYLQAQVQDHLDHPRDDLTTYLLNAEMDGEPVTIEHAIGTIALLLIAGIDTTWSAIGASLWHLAGHPADRERLVTDRDLLPIAMEELLRAYAPVTMARMVKQDVELGGCPMHVNDWVLLPFPAANRDPEAFEDAGRVVIDRAVNRHAAFGLGIHRCAGSHLARMELRVALEVWLDAFPVFHLSDPDAVRWSNGQVRGPRTVPVRIG